MIKFVIHPKWPWIFPIVLTTTTTQTTTVTTYNKFIFLIPLFIISVDWKTTFWILFTVKLGIHKSAIFSTKYRPQQTAFVLLQPGQTFFKWCSYNGSTWSVAMLKEHHHQQQPKTSKSFDAGHCVWVLKQRVNKNLFCQIYSFSVKGIHSWWKNQAYWSRLYQGKNTIYLFFWNEGSTSRVTFFLNISTSVWVLSTPSAGRNLHF